MTRARHGLAATASVLGALAVAALPAAAQAADACPNAAVRTQQHAERLPNCMAYEKVTPASKGGETPGALQITADGSGLTYMLNAGIEDAQSFTSARYRAMRSADGRWTTNALMAAMDGPKLPQLGDSAGDPLAVTPDLSRMVFDFKYPLDPNDQGTGTTDLFIREADGRFTWLVPDPSVPETAPLHVFFEGASPNLERIVMGTARPWDPRVTTTDVDHVYVRTATGMHLVTELPNGQLATDMPRANQVSGRIPDVTASDDARRITFRAGTKLYVRFNADDPTTAYTREVAVGPNGETCANSALEKLSADGRWLAFSCYSAILPGGPATGTYVRDLDGGPDAVRLIGEASTRVTANADFSRVYLASRSSANGSIWLTRDGGTTERIVTPVSTVSGVQFDEPEISVDGEYIAFTSPNDFGLPGVDLATRGVKQVYLYAARTRTLTCVSCRQDGRPTDGIGALSVRGIAGVDAGGGGATNSGMRPVGTNGAVVFTSTTALVPEDTNGKADAYAWIDGRAVLLSSGQSALPSAAQGGSADGSSLFFRTTDALVPDDRDGGTYDLYAVRVNGGTLVEDPAAAPCQASCQGPAPPVPGVPNVSTSTFVGRGNLVEETTKAAKPTASLTVPKSVRGSRTSVRVKVSRAGTIRLSGVGLRPAKATAKKAGTYRVTVRLSAYGAKQQRSRGRLATRVTARFAPRTGATTSARKPVTFTARKGGR